ncbi:hypothetical protein FACS189494_06780 [Spirochaetia bacterium]|nr:hypothetical protein FACS189494_06780 [Spirochaetia bacterium]
MNCFDIQALDLFYGDFQALKNINMGIERGKITAFIGPLRLRKVTNKVGVSQLTIGVARPGFFVGQTRVLKAQRIAYVM